MIGGPPRSTLFPYPTLFGSGITNADWFVTLGGDGFHCRVDPKDANTVYATLQYGVLSRFDRRTGQSTIIQPQAGKDDAPQWKPDRKSTRLNSSHQIIAYAVF